MYFVPPAAGVKCDFVALVVALVVGSFFALLWRRITRLPDSSSVQPLDVSTTPALLAATTGRPHVPNCKIVFVVRRDLKMSAGKIAAQASHAAVALHDVVSRARGSKFAEWANWSASWSHDNCKKELHYCSTEEQLLAIAKLAKEAALPWFVTCDAGRTQIAAGSRTVLAVGPAPAAKFDAIARSLLTPTNSSS